MHYVFWGHHRHVPDVRWDDLAGPFDSLKAAEDWLTNTAELGDPGTVTVRPDGPYEGPQREPTRFYVMSARKAIRT